MTNPPAPPAPPSVARLVYDEQDPDGCCWVLYLGEATDDPDAWADDLDADDVDAAQAWAEHHLDDEHDLRVADWTDGELLPGVPARVATLTTAAADERADAGAAPARAGDRPAEYRLLFDPVDGVWLVLRDDGHLADHDGLNVDDLDGACGWASGVVIDDCGRGVDGWQQRVGAGGTEHVAELLPAGEFTTAAAAVVETPAPRLAHAPDTGWALHTAAGVVATTGPDIQAEDLVAAQTWAVDELAADGVEVIRWTACPDGQPGYTAVIAQER